MIRFRFCFVLKPELYIHVSSESCIIGFHSLGQEIWGDFTVIPLPQMVTTIKGILVLCYWLMGCGMETSGGIFTEQRQPGQRDKQPTRRNTQFSRFTQAAPQLGITAQWQEQRQPRGVSASKERPWRPPPFPSSRSAPLTFHRPAHSPLLGSPPRSRTEASQRLRTLAGTQNIACHWRCPGERERGKGRRKEKGKERRKEEKGERKRRKEGEEKGKERRKKKGRRRKEKKGERKRKEKKEGERERKEGINTTWASGPNAVKSRQQTWKKKDFKILFLLGNRFCT